MLYRRGFVRYKLVSHCRPGCHLFRSERVARAPYDERRQVKVGDLPRGLSPTAHVHHAVHALRPGFCELSGERGRRHNERRKTIDSWRELSPSGVFHVSGVVYEDKNCAGHGSRDIVIDHRNIPARSNRHTHQGYPYAPILGECECLTKWPENRSTRYTRVDEVCR